MNTLAKMNANNSFLLNMPETIRQLREKQEELRKQEESWKKDYEEKDIKRIRETKREFDLFREQIENSTLDKRQIEQLIRTSSVIKDLRESISSTRQLFDLIPERLTQAHIDTAIATSEKETMKRDRSIEQSARDAGEQVKKVGNRLNELSIKAGSTSETISRTEIEKLIRQAIHNLKPTEQNENSELRKLIQGINDKLSQVEKRFDHYLQSTSVDNARNTDKELSGRTAMKNQLVAQKSLSNQRDHQKQHSKTISELPSNPYPQMFDLRSIEQRLTQLEDRLNASTNDERKTDDPLPVGNVSQIQSTAHLSNLQNAVQQHSGPLQQSSKNINDLRREKSIKTTVSQSNDVQKDKSTEQKNKSIEQVERKFLPVVQGKLNDDSIIILQNQIDNLNKTKPDGQRVDDLVKASEQRNEIQINDFRKRVNKTEDNLNKINADLAALHRQMTQQSTSISTKKDLPTRTYTEEKLQAIMPFIESLPMFDMLAENEWNSIY